MQGDKALRESQVLVTKRSLDFYKKLSEEVKNVLENIEQRLKKMDPLSDKPEGSKMGKTDGKGRGTTVKKV